MGLRARILRRVAHLPVGCGPATKNVLRGLCRDDKQRAAFDEIFRELLESGDLKMIGRRRGAVYGLGGR